MFCYRVLDEYCINIYLCVFFYKILNLFGCFYFIFVMMYVIMRENKGVEFSQIGKYIKISDDMN